MPFSNQLSSIGGTSTTHDARGNVTSDPMSGKTYGYSSENLLTSASGGVTLGYDPQLRLYQLAGGSTTRFAYDGLAMIAEYDGSNALQRRFVHGPGVDEPLVHYEGSGTLTRSWLHADERGSVIALSDGSGNATTINKYDEYGKPQATNSGRFQYTGQMWLSEIGAYYYKARAYSPVFGGRFLQTDPIGYEGGPNLYAYVVNDPVNLLDPMGEQACGGKHGPCPPPKPGDIIVKGKRPKKGGKSVSGSGLAAFLASTAVVQFELMDRFNRRVQEDARKFCDAALPDGSTINQNVDTIESEMETVEDLRQPGDPGGLGYYYSVGAWIARVQPHGKWDYKRLGGTETQGNMNYGATGAVLFPIDILLRGAGAVQEDPRDQLPGTPFDLPPSTYGDDPKDIQDIKQGAALCRGTGK